jgi:hypothetical protein
MGAGKSLLREAVNSALCPHHARPSRSFAALPAWGQQVFCPLVSPARERFFQKTGFVGRSINYFYINNLHFSPQNQFCEFPDVVPDRTPTLAAPVGAPRKLAVPGESSLSQNCIGEAIVPRPVWWEVLNSGVLRLPRGWLPWASTSPTLRNTPCAGRWPGAGSVHFVSSDEGVTSTGAVMTIGRDARSATCVTSA